MAEGDPDRRRGRDPVAGARRDLQAEVRATLADGSTTRGVRTLTGFADRLRVEAAAEHGQMFQDWRDRARAIKEDAIDRLPELIDQVTEAVEARGGTVHVCADAAEANRVVERICREAAGDRGGEGRTTVVKSKSMTTEEIDLNAHLEAAGVEVVETDLGEYVAQVAKERPSHIIGPVIHKTTDDIAALFRAEVDPSVPEDADAERLTRLARDRLREVFRRADVAVTGANFVVAETGTVALVTNEGNARWCVESAPVHVAVAGVEKLVAELEDLQVFYELLPKSATGQVETAYFTLLTPPRGYPALNADPGGDEGRDEGADDHGRAFHLVLLDNGRLEMADDPLLREALYCIRCGACLNACANYQAVGGHVYGGETYVGGIGAPWEAAVTGRDEAAAFNDLCTGCLQCRPACPVKIDIPWMNTVLRDRINRGLVRKESEAFVFPGLVPDDLGVPPSRERRFFGGFEARLRRMAPWAPLVNRAMGLGVVRRYLQSRYGIHPDRRLPRLHRRTFTSTWAGPAVARDDAVAEAVLLADAYTDVLAPDRLRAAARVLEAAGVRLHVEAPVSTGRDAYGQGMVRQARTALSRTLDQLRPHLDAGRTVVCVEPSVHALFVEEVRRLLPDADHAVLADRVVDVCEMVLDLVEAGRLELPDHEDAAAPSVYLHGHCQQRATGRFDATVRLLEAMGLDVRTSEVNCCGMAGTFGYKEETHALAMAVGEPLFDDVEDRGDRAVLATGISCTSQLQDGTGRTVRHPIELVADALAGPQPF